MAHVTNETENVPNDSKPQQIKQLFSNKLYVRILPYVASHALIGVMPTIIMPGFGGRWFSDCHQTGKQDDCEYNYTEYNFYNSLFASLRGVVGLLFAGFIGSLCDSYGRKPFLLIPTISCLITYALMSLLGNIWIFWGIVTIHKGLFGSTQVLSYIETAYIADIVSLDKKTLGFTIGIGFMSLSLAIGSGIAPAIAAMFDTSAVFLFMTVAYLLLTIYTIIFVKESLTSNRSIVHRSTRSICKLCNTFRPLLYINSNPIILYVAFIQVLCSPIQSTISIVLVYLNDQLNINDSNQSNLVNLLMYGTMSVSAFVIASIVIPLLKVHCPTFAKDINLVCVGVICFILYLLIMSSIAFITDDDGNNDDLMVYCYSIIIIASILLGAISGFVAAISGIVSTYINDNEQGIAFGVVQAYFNIFTILTPFTFGYGYNFSKKEMNFPSLIFYVMSVLLVIALFIAMGPLKRTVNQLDKTGHRLSVRKGTDDDKTLLLKQMPNTTK